MQQVVEIKRKIVSGDELSTSIKKGVDKLADTVKSTMGPKGWCDS
jgi:chaperonin GroEL (HSP60 family)